MILAIEFHFVEDGFSPINFLKLINNNWGWTLVWKNIHRHVLFFTKLLTLLLDVLIVFNIIYSIDQLGDP